MMIQSLPSHLALEQDVLSLIQAFDRFPVSSDKSTMLYDYSKLLLILREKELTKICNNFDTIQKAQLVSSSFGNILSTMRKNAKEGIRLYRALEKKSFKEFNGLLYIYVKQWAISIEALYYYKTGNLAMAGNLTLECIALNDILIHEGLSTLVFRSAEQNRNYARVLTAKNNSDQGAKMAVAVLSYLLNGKSDLLMGDIFKKDYYWQQNSYLREGYGYEIFKGLVHNIIILSGNFTDRQNLFYLYFNDFTLDVTTIDRSLIFEWISIKKTFYQIDFTDFVQLFINYMEKQTTKSYDILKIALLQDIVEVIFTSPSAHAINLITCVNNYLNEIDAQYFYLRKFIKCYPKV